MRRGPKRGGQQYAKFIDSYRKTKPQMPASGLKKHKRKKKGALKKAELKKSDMSFEATPSNKLRSKFDTKPDSEGSASKDDLITKPTLISQVSTAGTMKSLYGKSLSVSKPVRKAYQDFLQQTGLQGDLKKSDPIKAEKTIHGIKIAIEWPKGVARKYTKNGKLVDGNIMKASYGFVPDTYTEDGEDVDVYLGDNLESKRVFLLLQKPTPWDVKNGFTDPEEKWCLGFYSSEEAEKAYKGSMPSRWFKSIKEVSWDEFILKIRTAKKELARAKKVDLVLLPQEIEGKKCETCIYFGDMFCGHKDVNMPVTEKMSCKLWENAGTKVVGEEVNKAVGVEIPRNEMLGMFTPPGIESHFSDFSTGNFKKIQGNLKKDLESMPVVTAAQGSKEQGSVYSFHDADTFGKAIHKKRIKLADKLDKLSKSVDLTKGNAFVGNAGFVQRPRPKAADSSVESAAFRSVATESITKDVKEGLNRLKKLKEAKKSMEVVDGGMLKRQALLKIDRITYNNKDLDDSSAGDSSNSGLDGVKKSIDFMIKKINDVPLLVFKV